MASILIYVLGSDGATIARCFWFDVNLLFIYLDMNAALCICIQSLHDTDLGKELRCHQLGLLQLTDLITNEQ